MPRFSLEMDQAQVRELERVLAEVKNGAGKVVSRAVNKTLAGVRTDATEEIRKTLNLKASTIRESFTINKATVNDMRADVTSRGEPLGLIHFGARKTKKGVTVQVLKTSKRSLIKHAFIAAVKQTENVQTENVWWRKWTGDRKPVRPGVKYGRLPKRYRLPVERLTGPRIQDIYSHDEVMGAVLKKAQERLDVNLEREAEYELSKLR